MNNIEEYVVSTKKRKRYVSDSNHEFREDVITDIPQAISKWRRVVHQFHTSLISDCTSITLEGKAKRGNSTL
jgi:hypothetical protein